MAVSNPSLSVKKEEDLVARIREGDDTAFEDLLVRYQEKVYRLALYMTGHPQEAEEILQETFLKVFQKIDSFRGDAKFSTWLHQIALNTARMHQRANSRKPTESLEKYLPQYDATGRLARLDLDYGRVARADQLLEQSELAEKVVEAIGQLPEIYRSVVVLRDLEELTTEEVMEILGLEAGTVRSRLHRARLMLRGYLGHILGGEK
jgi:RNA polymerase sigma-70 factor, ECF subfamily